MLRYKVAKGLNECICVETEDNGNTIGLPYPYSVPTQVKSFILCTIGIRIL